MATLTVKLTHTALGNTATNPENSHTCDLVFATVANLQELQRDTGDYSGIHLGVITMVEAFCHGRAAGISQYTIFAGHGMDESNFPGESNDLIQYFDITFLRVWTWADFASVLLHITIKWFDPVNDLEVPCIGFRIIYTPAPIPKQTTILPRPYWV